MADEPQGGSPEASPPNQGPAPEPVTIESVPQISSGLLLKEVGAAKEGTFTQRAGMKLAKWVGTLGAVVTLLILGRWLWITWCLSCLNIPASTPVDQAKAILDNYKGLQDQALQSAKDMFDAVVVKALLPVFTSILGYIFGARSASEGQSDGDEKAA